MTASARSMSRPPARPPAYLPDVPLWRVSWDARPNFTLDGPADGPMRPDGTYTTRARIALSERLSVRGGERRARDRWQSDVRSVVTAGRDANGHDWQVASRWALMPDPLAPLWWVEFSTTHDGRTYAAPLTPRTLPCAIAIRRALALLDAAEDARITDEATFAAWLTQTRQAR